MPLLLYLYSLVPYSHTRLSCCCWDVSLDSSIIINFSCYVPSFFLSFSFDIILFFFYCHDDDVWNRIFFFIFEFFTWAEKYADRLERIFFEVLGTWRNSVSVLNLLLDNIKCVKLTKIGITMFEGLEQGLFGVFSYFIPGMVVMGLSDPVENNTCGKHSFRYLTGWLSWTCVFMVNLTNGNLPVQTSFEAYEKEIIDLVRYLKNSISFCRVPTFVFFSFWARCFLIEILFLLSILLYFQSINYILIHTYVFIYYSATKSFLNCLQLTCNMLQPNCHPNFTKMFWHSHCAVCTVTVHQILVESLFEDGWSKNRTFLGLSACQLQAVEKRDLLHYFSVNHDSSFHTESIFIPMLLAGNPRLFWFQKYMVILYYNLISLWFYNYFSLYTYVIKTHQLKTRGNPAERCGSLLKGNHGPCKNKHNRGWVTQGKADLMRKNEITPGQQHGIFGMSSINSPIFRLGFNLNYHHHAAPMTSCGFNNNYFQNTSNSLQVIHKGLIQPTFNTLTTKKN
ncbi:putative signal peptide protein [Puccinia sorghi]|uniref:Putative signal peptide protein n=1 Tax=Puccinia sorghi TaxID=27349 RepID=A0A0L6UYR8_9BASI|nr:putative signal peptide protein [Puccinia sorghi]